MNVTIDKYKKDTVVQSLPSLAYVNRAKKLIDSGNFLEAECILNSALSLPQEDALVYKYLGLIAERTGRKFDAITAYKKSANIDSADKDIWRMLGFMLVSANKAEEAIDVFENANKITPLNSEVLTGWGMALMRLKNYNEAHQKLVSAININKYNFMAMFLCAVVEMKLELFDDAQTKLKFLASVNPNETNLYEYAHLNYIKGDFDSAIHYAKQSLVYNANMLPAYALIGEIYYKKKDEKNSLAAYNQAYERELINENLYCEWGTALQVFGKYEEAKDKFSKVLEFDENREDAKAGLALCFAALEDIEEAEAILGSLCDKIKNSYLSLKAQAFIAYKKGDYSAAIELFKDVLKTEPYDTILYYYIAKSYMGLSNDVLTKEYFEKSINENPSHTVSYIDYANYLINKSDYSDAQRKLRRALKFDENNLDILNIYFYVSYILVKENVCEYNVKETLNIADKIISISSEGFRYRKEKDELSEMLNK